MIIVWSSELAYLGATRPLIFGGGGAGGAILIPKVEDGHINYTQIRAASRSGSGPQLQTISAAGFVSGHIPEWDVNGDLVDSGPPSTGGITQLTGDVTAGPGSGSQAATLAATAVTAGSYTNTNITVDAKGRLTAASNGSGGSGTVTTTGSPASGNLSAFSGATSITNTDLTGAVTTSGTSATTMAANAVATSNIQASAVTLAKIQNAAANSKLLGSGASGSGSSYAELTLGTNLSMSGTTLNATSSGGSSWPPFTFIQSCNFTGTAGTSITCTFPSALQSSGATAWMVIVQDATSAFTTPTGWTKDIDSSSGSSGTTNRVVVMHKASASDTNVVVTYGASGTFVAYFFELSGSHALDQSASSNSATASNPVNFSSITPTAGSMIFAIAGSAYNSTPPQFTTQQSVMAPWIPMWLNTSASNSRVMFGFMALFSGAGTVVQPPQMTARFSTFFSSTGMAWTTFSIL